MPEVRFEGFRDEWIACKLGEKAEILTGGTPRTQIREYWEPKEVPWMSSGEINKKRILYTDNKISKLGLNNSSARWISENSVLIALAGQGKTRGTVAINLIPLTINQSIAAIIPKGELYYEFIYQNLAKRYEELRIISSGDGTRGGLNKQILSEIEIVAPSFNEQIKIGNLLKQLDETIAFQQQDIDTLRQTKQGFLQKMFPKEGESVPEIRFSGFSGEWERQKFKNLAKVRRGLTYTPISIRQNGVRVLRSSNICDDTFVIGNDDVFVNPKAINIDFVKENDILITAANGSSRLVGKHALIKNVGKDAVHGGFMLVATAKIPLFINAMMSSTWYKKFINVHVSGGNGAIGNLNKNALEEQTVYVPQIEEQKMIGNFFGKLDNTIALQQQELENLKQTKKAFLQKMFV